MSVGGTATPGAAAPMDPSPLPEAACRSGRVAGVSIERPSTPDLVRASPPTVQAQGDPRACRTGSGEGRSIRRARPASRQRGYSLLEVIVAFGVLGVALSLLLGTLSGGTRQVRWAADSGRAVLHAQSLLDEVGVGEVLVPGRRDGEFEQGRFRWELEVAPYVDPDRLPVQPADPYAPQLLQLRLRVSWGDGGPRERLQLDTLRLVQPDPSGLSG